MKKRRGRNTKATKGIFLQVLVRKRIDIQAGESSSGVGVLEPRLSRIPLPKSGMSDRHPEVQ